jgi:hypothetical protein
MKSGHPKLRSKWSLLLLLSTLLFVGCGSSQDFVFTNGSSIAQGSTLTVQPDVSAPVSPRISDNATNFRITIYNSAGTQLNQFTVTRGDSAVFTGLSNGLYLVRTGGLDAGGTLIGYFDLSVTVNGDTSVVVPALIYSTSLPTNTVPSAATGAIRFIAFSELPDAITGGTDFDIVVTAYDSDGSVFTGANGTVTLASTGATGNFGSANYAGGRAEFRDLQFPIITDGTAIFQATDGTGSIPIFMHPQTPASS